MPSIALACSLRRRFARTVRLAVPVCCGIAVAGCTAAVETFRAVRGFNMNDPDPVSAPFTGNMAAATTAPFPNLASVPPPPTRVTTAAERQKLIEKLIAEREAAQAAAAPAATVAPSPAPSGAVPAPPPTQALTAAPQPQTGAAVQAPPAPAAEAPPAALPETPPAPQRVAETAPQPVSAPATPPTSETGARSGASDTVDQALPRDSDLRMPQVRSLPEPETHRPAPPPPSLRPVPPPTEPGQIPPAAIASATPQPVPPMPEFTAIMPPAPSLAAIEPPRPAGGTTIAMIDMPDSGRFDPEQITQIVSRYQERIQSQPPLRAVRIIAYTAAPAPGADPLSGYHDALERAQGVAKVLTEAGIPEKMTQSEAKPTPDPTAAARVEIQFLP